MKIINLTLFTVLLLIFVNCQQNKDVDTSIIQKVIKDSILYSIDTALIKLPERISVANPTILFDSLSRISFYLPIKGEFETTQEYMSRSNRFKDSVLIKPVVNNLKLNSLYVIDLDHSLHLSYNADEGIMEFVIYLHEEYSDYPDYFNEDEFKHKYQKSAVYKIRTQFYNIGDISMSDELWIKFENFTKGKMKNYFKESNEWGPEYKFKSSLKMDRNYAMQEKNNSRMLAIIKLIKPWYKDWHDCTLESRFTINKKAIMYTEIVQVWIYNYKTGEIYFKIKS